MRWKTDGNVIEIQLVGCLKAFAEMIRIFQFSPSGVAANGRDKRWERGSLIQAEDHLESRTRQCNYPSRLVSSPKAKQGEAKRMKCFWNFLQECDLRVIVSSPGSCVINFKLSISFKALMRKVNSSRSKLPKVKRNVRFLKPPVNTSITESCWNPSLQLLHSSPAASNACSRCTALLPQPRTHAAAAGFELGCRQEGTAAVVFAAAEKSFRLPRIDLKSVRPSCGCLPRQSPQSREGAHTAPRRDHRATVNRNALCSALHALQAWHDMGERKACAELKRFFTARTWNSQLLALQTPSAAAASAPSWQLLVLGSRRT